MSTLHLRCEGNPARLRSPKLLLLHSLPPPRLDFFLNQILGVTWVLSWFLLRNSRVIQLPGNSMLVAYFPPMVSPSLVDLPISPLLTQAVLLLLNLMQEKESWASTGQGCHLFLKSSDEQTEQFQLGNSRRQDRTPAASTISSPYLIEPPWKAGMQKQCAYSS